jgi:hypothetical protein
VKAGLLFQNIPNLTVDERNGRGGNTLLIENKDATRLLSANGFGRQRKYKASN